MGDVVTQAQQQVNNMCSLMFNFTGALQRDAPKASVSGEAVPPPHPDFDQQCRTMAEQLISTSQRIDRLIGQLPDLSLTLEERRVRVADLWKERGDLAEELRAQTGALEVSMSELEELFGVMVEADLAHAEEPREDVGEARHRREAQDSASAPTSV
eukprot:evm.model.scf_2003.2 EVM.evm.TU.scf_2003.2   scf_2003:5925-10034(+)